MHSMGEAHCGGSKVLISGMRDQWEYLYQRGGGKLGLCDDASIGGSQVEVLDCIQWGGVESTLNVAINVGSTLWWKQVSRKNL